jgi:hypothetical protein
VARAQRLLGQPSAPRWLPPWDFSAGQAKWPRQRGVEEISACAQFGELVAPHAVCLGKCLRAPRPTFSAQKAPSLGFLGPDRPRDPTRGEQRRFQPAHSSGSSARHGAAPSLGFFGRGWPGDPDKHRSRRDTHHAACHDEHTEFLGLRPVLRSAPGFQSTPLRLSGSPGR